MPWVADCRDTGNDAVDLPGWENIIAAGTTEQSSCAPTNWWSAAALGGPMTGGGDAPRIFHRRRRRAFMVSDGGVRPDERALKQHTHWTGVFLGYTGVSHLWSPLGRWRRKLNCEYAWCAQFYSLNELIVHCLISGGSYKCNVECWWDADSAAVENAALENADWKMWE